MLAGGVSPHVRQLEKLGTMSSVHKARRRFGPRPQHLRHTTPSTFSHTTTTQPTATTSRAAGTHLQVDQRPLVHRLIRLSPLPQQLRELRILQQLVTDLVCRAHVREGLGRQPLQLELLLLTATRPPQPALRTG